MKTLNANNNLNSNEVRGIFKKARDAETQGHYALAAELLRKVINCDPSRGDAKYRAARNLIEVGRISEAKGLLDEITEVPESKRWLVELTLGQLRMAQFKPSLAEHYFRAALKLNPESTSPSVLLADCLMRQERTDEARRVLLKALRAKGDLDEVYLNLGLILRMRSDYKSAKRYFLKALRLTPGYKNAQHLLRDVESCLKMGKVARLSSKKGVKLEWRLN